MYMNSLWHSGVNIGNGHSPTWQKETYLKPQKQNDSACEVPVSRVILRNLHRITEQ